MIELTRKELPYFRAGGAYGGVQDWYGTWLERAGGCGCTTAADVSIYFKKYFGRDRLYSGDADHISKEDYVALANRIMPYLHPRFTGIDTLKLYTDGFEEYLADIGEKAVTLRTLDGHASAQEAAKAVEAQIDQGLPMAMLVLRHRNPRFNFYVWHWFILNGYEKRGQEFRVKATTYGTFRWLDFYALWNTGYERKGGLVFFDCCNGQ